MKLRNVQAYPIKDVPDHLTHECLELGKNLLEILLPHLNNRDPNIVLGAFTFLHASLIKDRISNDPEQLSKAAKIYALGLIKNIEFLAHIDILNEEK